MYFRFFFLKYIFFLHYSFYQLARRALMGCYYDTRQGLLLYSAFRDIQSYHVYSRLRVVSFNLVNTRMRCKQDIKMGRGHGLLVGCVRRGGGGGGVQSSELSVGGVTFRFINGEAILDEKMLA